MLMDYMHLYAEVAGELGERDNKMHSDMYGDGGGSQPGFVAW